MKRLKEFIVYVFFLGFFFLPFNDFQGVEALGEFKREAGAYFFMIGFVFLIIYSVINGKFYLPYKSGLFKLLLLFILWCFITVVLNLSTVTESFFKQTTGINRFIRQYISLLLSTFVFVVFFWNVIKEMSYTEILARIRKVLLSSLIFVFIYGFLETLVVFFGIGFIKPILALFDYFPFLDVGYSHDSRISSVCYESPALGNYLITVSGWMFSYVLTEKSKYRFLPTIMILFLAFFSGSRTAFINIGLQLAIFIYVLYSIKEYQNILINIFKYAFLIISVALIFNGNKIAKAFDEKLESLNFAKNLKGNVSNQSRFGMQYASIQVFKENPIIGVGFGQETYHKRFHYPLWAKKNNYEFKAFYENKSVKSFPTAYNIYTRLLAETGIIGTFLWVSLIYFSISKSSILWKHRHEEEKALGFILLVSFAGLSLNWMQTDFFRQYGYWLCLVILIKLLNEDKNKTISGHES